jgi:hypothetical protein
MGIVKTLSVVLAAAGMCMPQALMAAETAARQPITADVALTEGGVLLGQVVDTEGAARAEVPVAILAGGRELALAKTDGSGYFAFRGLRGGVYQLVAAEGHGLYRVWSPGTAPPSAQQGALVVAGQDMVRGNWGPVGESVGWTKFWLSNPWVIGAIVTTAVVIPVALHNAEDDDEPMSP